MSANALPDWRVLLRGARQREGRSPGARWLQLASVGTDGTPRVRTLVFRGWADAVRLDLLSDGRSSKAEELAAQPAVELCWLLPKAGSQFRLRGHLERLDGADLLAARERHWLQLSPAGRALWGWPAPGQALDPAAAFPSELADGTPLPPHFLLLRVHVEQVELLELTGTPHRRQRWREATGWRCEALNT
ncbi:pyridoxamine 5'-phosphate oxidase family protein [Synechococcus sp. ATX 2A4]|uniref:pyridoxamine 5'-phosphate oxidase family protein n=1 Tax=Synechococcus sp. ATX 2A4 TaxID=2823727 RepID=UPI0020CFD1D5|nr:pyridoxamine 5'-phosphate oxidase family protein [Synechococcus sp. ATX 2A4]MCP9885602.1 pyridoxamine 5'-phosphate oxidase family protein [Synechococcus sp. ATX 2A4]